jgi:16S rRNA (guanine527-N7)-methyltransferase
MINLNNEAEILKTKLKTLCENNLLYLNNLDEVINKAGEHFSLLLKWNQKISLTTITNPQLAANQLYFESLFAAKFIPPETKSLTDIGTGAGFPGLPLALALPQINTTLIESDQRKFAFLGETRRTLKLTNLSILNQRFQQVSSTSEIFTVRALEKLQTLIIPIINFASKAKLIIFFISQPTAKNILETYKKELLDYKIETISLPESENRVLLLLHNQKCFT